MPSLKNAAKRAGVAAQGPAVTLAGATSDEPGLYTAVCKQTPPLRYTLGIVYAPLAVDAHDDFASADTIRKAAWGFMTHLQMQAALTKRTFPILLGLLDAARKHYPVKVDVTMLATELTKVKPMLGDQHESWDPALGTIVECYVMPCDVELAGQPVVAGTWMLGVQWAVPYFAKIMAGERTGYSFGGWARRRFVPEEPQLGAPAP
jgi:hypothetical protein